MFLTVKHLKKNCTIMYFTLLYKLFLKLTLIKIWYIYTDLYWQFFLYLFGFSNHFKNSFQFLLNTKDSGGGPLTEEGPSCRSYIALNWRSGLWSLLFSSTVFIEINWGNMYSLDIEISFHNLTIISPQHLSRVFFFSNCINFKAYEMFLFWNF